MRIAVCVAAVPNPENVKWDRFRALLDVESAEPVLNPVDRHALELAAALAKSTGSSFDAVCVGFGASAALREAAVFGAQRLIAIVDDSLETADEAGVATALSAALKHLGGADVIFCGSSTASYGSGAVPGYLSAHLDASLLVDALGADVIDGQTTVTVLGPGAPAEIALALPAVITAAPFGIRVRAISPLLLMKAAKKPIETSSLPDIGCALPLPTTGAADGPLESARSKKGMEVVDGPDAATRAIMLVAALREKQAV